MEKFLTALKDKAWALATGQLETLANSFSFRREVPKVYEAAEAQQLGEELYLFSVAFVLAIAQRHPDGRNEKCVGLAKQFVTDGLGIAKEDVDALLGVEHHLAATWMHPTVMQQAAQLAFYTLAQAGTVPTIVSEDKQWWTMPLI